MLFVIVWPILYGAMSTVRTVRITIHAIYFKHSYYSYQLFPILSSGAGPDILFGGVSGPGVNPKIALAIAGMGVSPPHSPLPEMTEQARRPTLTLDTTRQLLACFCWTLKNMDRFGIILLQCRIETCWSLGVQRSMNEILKLK